MAAPYLKSAGTQSLSYQIGLGALGTVWVNASGALEARNPAGALVVVRVAEPVGVNDAVPQGDFLLDNSPVPPPLGAYTLTLTYNPDGTIQKKVWTNNAGGLAIKQVVYSYANGLVASFVATLYATDGVTPIAVATTTLTYAGGKISTMATARSV